MQHHVPYLDLFLQHKHTRPADIRRIALRHIELCCYNTALFACRIGGVGISTAPFNQSGLGRLLSVWEVEAPRCWTSSPVDMANQFHCAREKATGGTWERQLVGPKDEAMMLHIIEVHIPHPCGLQAQTMLD